MSSPEADPEDQVDVRLFAARIGDAVALGRCRCQLPFAVFVVVVERHALGQQRQVQGVAVVGPGAEFELAGLGVVRVESQVELAGGLEKKICRNNIKKINKLYFVI